MTTIYEYERLTEQEAYLSTKKKELEQELKLISELHYDIASRKFEAMNNLHAPKPEEFEEGPTGLENLQHVPGWKAKELSVGTPVKQKDGTIVTDID